MSNLQPDELPYMLACPHCNTPQKTVHEMGKTGQKPEIGDVFLCGQCGTPSILRLIGGWQAMDDNDWIGLDNDDIKALREAMLRIQYHKLDIEQREKKGRS